MKSLLSREKEKTSLFLFVEIPLKNTPKVNHKHPRNDQITLSKIAYNLT